MKYILGLFAVLLLSGGMVVSDVKQAEAGSRRNAAIAGAIIGGAIAGAAVANHRRHHSRHYDYDEGYGRSHYVVTRHCRRVTRCRWRRARRWWSGGVRHYRPAGETCRRVRRCR